MAFLFLFVFACCFSLTSCSLYESSGREELRKNGADFADNISSGTPLDHFEKTDCSFFPFEDFDLAEELPLSHSSFLGFLTETRQLVFLMSSQEQDFACRFKPNSEDLSLQVKEGIALTKRFFDLYQEL